MGYDGYEMKSKPLVIEDATLKLQGIEVIQGLNQVEPADIVEAINGIVGTRLKVSEDAPELKDVLNPPMAPLPPGMGATNMNPNAKATVDKNGVVVPINPVPQAPSGPNPNGMISTTPPKPALARPTGTGSNALASANMRKCDEPLTALQLAHDLMVSMRKRDVPALAKSLDTFNVLDTAAQERVLSAAAELQFIDPSLDLQGLSELASCTMEVMTGHGHAH
jgi:hypothetical protein